MPQLQLLHGPAAEKALRRSDAQIFHYSINKPVLGAIAGLGAICAGLSAGWAIWVGLSDAINIAVFVIGCIASVYFAGRAYYWYTFAASQNIVISDTHLLLGDKRRVWAIAWDLLDTQKVGLDDIELGKMQATLTINVGREAIPLRLFNAFIYLENLERFIGTVLEHVPLSSDDHGE